METNLSIAIILCLVVATVQSAAIGKERSIQKRFGCFRFQCSDNEVCKENHYGEAYCLPADQSGAQGSKGREFIKRLLEVLESKKSEDQQSYKRRFGCNHYNCGDDEMCLENRWGEAYCVDDDTPGVGRGNGEKRNYDKRFGCHHYDCESGEMCLENRWGDAYCVDESMPGANQMKPENPRQK